ncbi:HEAT repeat domain-containing protein [Akkermansiaceae bacterium]|nr:HEAT repeat domain-containing protein [Akkermansiaceae bacterium]
MKNNNIHHISIATLALVGSVMAEVTEHAFVSPSHLSVPEGFEVKLWANSPLFFNPTNIDTDYKGRVWVAEGRRYRAYRNKAIKLNNISGDRIMVLEDSDANGQADKSHVFVQDPDLIAPLGLAVIDNMVVVSQPPSIIVYHDVNRDAIFDPKVDKKELLLTGFGGQDHDHSLHAVTTGPSGQWYFNTGNAGTHIIKDNDGWTLRLGSSYRSGSPSVTAKGPNQGGKAGLKSDDGHVYVGSAVLRMNPDGTGLRVVGHNMRNSYEETVNSFGDVYQNDNDDPPACRTTWLMEYGNLGFASDDGTRTWKTDRRPGQSTAIAEWRQEDPGKIPAGDVYGSGSPTGICFYENGSFDEKWNGLLLSCEAAHNVIFGYLPKPQGAGFALERFDFLKATAPDGEKVPKQSNPNNFRPSDITIGHDGSLYVADWFDDAVGGHATADLMMSGAIYRITPKGKNPKVSTIDLDTVAGQIAALKSPANNVRNLGFTRLKAGGEKSVTAVKSLLNDPSKYFQARAIWLLAQLGDEGVKEVEQFLKTSDDDQLRITCFRALRFIDHNVHTMCKSLASDKSPAVRREIALALRDTEWKDSGEIILELFRKFNSQDRWALEALGTAATRKESQFFQSLLKEPGANDPLAWSDQMIKMVWRLHPPEAVEYFEKQVLSASIPVTQRKDTLTALAYIKDISAALVMVKVAEQGPEDTRPLAKWWLSSLSRGAWSKFTNKMKGLHIKADAPSPDNDYIIPFKNPDITNYTVKDVLALEGSAEKGKQAIASCYMCHQVNGTGVDFGPALDGWGGGRSKEAIAEAIINPNVAVAHGFEGSEIITKSGHTIHGIYMAAGAKKAIIQKIMGGSEVTIPKANVKSVKRLDESLMLSAKQLGLSAQNVADIVAFMKSDK